MVEEEKQNPFGDGEEIKADFNVWKPTNEGDKIRGTVLMISEDAQYGKQYKLALDDGSEMWTPSHKYLQNRLKDIVEGDKIGIVYDGEELPSVKGNNPTKIYRVYMLTK